MTINHLFIIDPLASLNLALDSSLRMMLALSHRSHEAWICEPKDLFWESPNQSASCHAKRLIWGGKIEEVQVVEEKTVPLSGFRAIHMRKDPPYDLDYITVTWMLSSAGSSTKIYNRPEALRSYNEKLLIFKFPAQVRSALFSSDIEQIMTFIKERCDYDGIIKPLHLFGGRGVQRLKAKSKQDEDETRRILAEETQNGASAKLIQPFDKSIFQGEVRAFTAFGEPISWCLKKPADGQYLANTRTGATLHPYSPTTEEEARVRTVAKKLNELGMPIVGFDMIGGYLSEMNITSPRLLQAPADHGNYYEKLAILFEQDLTR